MEGVGDGIGVQAAWEIMCQDSNKHHCEVWGWYVVDDCGLVPVDGMHGWWSSHVLLQLK